VKSLVKDAQAADCEGVNIVSNGINFSVVRDVIGNQVALTILLASQSLSIANRRPQIVLSRLRQAI
jgi:hypothetical protein